MSVSDSQWISPCDRETASLLATEIFSDQVIVRATEIVDAVGPILANVNLSIGIGNLVDYIHRRRGDNPRWQMRQSEHKVLLFIR